jgi:hypothetical protein
VSRHSARKGRKTNPQLGSVLARPINSRTVLDQVENLLKPHTQAAMISRPEQNTVLVVLRAKLDQLKPALQLIMQADSISNE